MNIKITASLLFLFYLIEQAYTCESYSCDSLVVRSILDENHLFTIPVESVTDSGMVQSRDTVIRIKGVDFKSLKLKAISENISNLNSLSSLNLNNNQLQSLPTSITKLEFYSNYIPNYGSIRINGLRVDSNYLCTLPENIEQWIYNNVPGNKDNKWKATQSTSDGSACADAAAISTSAKEFAALKIKNHSDFIIFETDRPSLPERKQIIVFDLKGFIVKTFDNVSGTILWETKNQNKGVYLIKMVVHGRSLHRIAIIN